MLPMRAETTSMPSRPASERDFPADALDARTESFRDRYLEHAVVGARRIDMRGQHFAGGGVRQF